MEEKKEAFKYKKSWLKVIANRLDYQVRGFYMLGFTVLLMSSGWIYDALQRGRVEEYKKKWLKTHVKNMDNTRYNHLDVEDPPAPTQPAGKVYRKEFYRNRAY